MWRNKYDVTMKQITRISKKQPQEVFKYIFLLMKELRDGGIALCNVGEGHFISKNYKMLRGNYMKVINQIYSWYLEEANEFQVLMNDLKKLIEDDDFFNMSDLVWYRFLKVKSLHDASILGITFNKDTGLLEIKVNTDHAIDYVPFDEVINLKFYTQNFYPEKIEKLSELVKKYDSIIFGIRPFVNKGKIFIELDYDCYHDSIGEEVKLPILDFECDNLVVENSK